MESHVSVSLLIPAAANTRRTNRLVDIDVLAALIKSQGLLQNLVVRDNGHGKYEVVDGRRRLAALKALIKSGDWPRTRPVAINVLSSEHNDTEVSLAANIGRVDMHPADTFEAFRLLGEKEGASPEAIGIRFGYAASTVRGFLKLANVSPRLMKAFRKDEISLDQMKALAITDDHKRQEEAFFAAPEYLRNPRDLRRRVMEGRIGADDKLARFVGAMAYEAAGGALTRDLFAIPSEGDVYFEDSGLLHRLAAEKLETEAAPYREQGWKWVEIQPDFTQSDLDRQSRISTASHGLAPDSDVARLHAGAILGIDREGNLRVLTGVLKPEDAKALKRAQAKERRASGTDVVPSAPTPANGNELSAVLVEELSAEKTAALRTLIAGQPDVALAIVAHDLALPLFYDPWDSAGPLTTLKTDITDVKSFLANGADRKAIVETKATLALWRERLPGKSDDLWPWLRRQQREVALDLLAIAVAANVDAIRYRHERAVSARLASGERLAQAFALDMRDWWQVDAGFLSRISKAAILSAIAEAISPETARSLDRCGKSELVAIAERRLTGTGWLPAALRPSAPSTARPAESPVEMEGVAEGMAHSAAAE